MTRRVLVAATALFLAAAVAVAVGSRPARPSAGPNIFVNPVGVIDAYSTPTVVQNPRQPAQLVAVYRQDRPRFNAQLAWSSDRGARWRTTPLPLPPGTQEAFFPDAAFGPDGTFYTVFVDLAGRGNVPADLFLVRSADGGRSLSEPVRVAGANTFQPRIAVGANGAIYLTWLQVVAEPGAPLAGAPVQVVATMSSDGGRTFAPPVVVSPAGTTPSSPVPVLGPSGGLVIAYQDLEATPEGQQATDRSELVVSRATTPGSLAFDDPVAVSHVMAHQLSNLFDNMFPSLASSPDGNLYLAWSQRRPGGAEQVLLSASADGGARWSAPAPISGDAGAIGPIRYLPALSVAPSGRLDLAFLAERGGPFADVYLATSANRGRSFEVSRLSSASFDARIGPNFGQGLPADVGSHLGLIASSTGVAAAWADSRLGTTTTGRQDIVVTQLSLVHASAFDRPVTIGGIALAVAAVGLLVVAGVRGRRRGDGAR